MRCGKKQKKTTNSVINITKIKFLSIMKIRNFLVAALVAIGLAACQSDDAPNFNGETGAPATVSIKVFADTPHSRAVGDLTGGALGTAPERAIHSLEIWLFGAGGNYYGHHFFENPASGTDFFRTADGSYVAEGIESTSGIRTMVAVANRAEIGPVTRTVLRDQLSGALTQDLATGLIMTSAEVEIILEAGENLFGRVEGTHHEGGLPGSFNHISPDANLQLVRINARIALVEVNFENETDDPRFNGFELYEVAMFNVRNNSRLFGTTSFATNQSLVHGTGAAAFSFGSESTSPADFFPSALNSFQIGTPTADLIVNMEEESITELDDISITNAIHFYVFENSGDRLVTTVEDKPVVTRPNRNGTFIVLKGRLLHNGTPWSLPGVYTDAAGFTYYAIWINDACFGVTGGTNVITRNTQYNLTVNIWGPGNPTIDPKEEAFLDVHVEVAPWVVVNQEVNWGRPPNGGTPLPLTQPNPTNITIPYGGTHTFVLGAATGGSGGYTYQWQSSLNGTTGWTNIVGEDGINFTIDSFTIDSFTGTHRFFRRRVVDSDADYHYTTAAQITVFATRNVGAEYPQDPGYFFQWGSNTPWLWTGTERVSVPAGETWLTPAEQGVLSSWNDGVGPCPAGWRLPVSSEMTPFMIAAGVWDWERTTSWGDTAGLIVTTFTCTTNEDNYILFPAAGRFNSDGAFGVAEIAFWWSGSSNAANTNSYRFQSMGLPGGTGFGLPANRAWAFNVRCVMN